MLDKDTRDKLNRLRRRMEYLRSRVLDANQKGQDLSYDKAELSALTWAVNRLERNEDE